MFARFLRRRARPRKAPLRSTARAEAERDRTSARDEYDELDRRLMDTFPASDAVARYCFDTEEHPGEGQRS